MNTLTLDVSKNTLKISAASSMTSGNEGYLQVSLILDADWAGAAIYPAYVVGGTEYSDYPATAIAGTTFIIPTAIGQSDGIIRLGLIGVADSVIMRTNYVFIPLLIGAATGTAVPLPTPAALEALQAAIAAKQDTLTAGTNITITDNVISASGGGGGGAVNSVNGEVGDVVLTASEVGADASGTASSAVSAHNISPTAHIEKFADYVTFDYLAMWELDNRADWTENDASNHGYILNKPTIPTTTSELANDSGYATENYVTSAIAAAITGAIEGSY